MLYLAYGSNMYTPRLRYRVKSAKPVGVVQVHDYALQWHKRSKDGSGKCNVIATPGSSIFGVAFDLDSKEKPDLDAAEGVGYGYNENQLNIVLEGKQVRVFVYLADAAYIDNSLRPYTWYKDFVVSGATEHGLPNAYLRSLQAQQALDDPKPEREKAERAKLAR